MGELSPEEKIRFSRQIILPHFGQSAQKILKESKVLVVGIGGLGCPATQYLAGAGIGTIGLADFDTVALHNLHRQIIFSPHEIGLPKIEVAKKKLSNYFPEGHYVLHPDGITQENAEEIFSSYDLILDCADNFQTRYLINDAAFFTKKPFVQASLFQWEGRTVLYHPSSPQACHRCLYPTPPAPETVPNCAEAGALGSLCGTVASSQVTLAIKWLISPPQKRPSITSQLFYQDSLNNINNFINIPVDPACPLCGDKSSRTIFTPEPEFEKNCTTSVNNIQNKQTMYPLEISITETKDILEKNEAILIDVREEFERDICKIDGAVHIPMNDVPERISELSADQYYLIQCHHGGRSLRVTEYLRSNGFDKVSNISGGIDQWAEKIDPSMSRY